MCMRWVYKPENAWKLAVRRKCQFCIKRNYNDILTDLVAFFSLGELLSHSHEKTLAFHLSFSSERNSFEIFISRNSPFRRNRLCFWLFKLSKMRFFNLKDNDSYVKLNNSKNFILSNFNHLESGEKVRAVFITRIKFECFCLWNSVMRNKKSV